jgi:hypothetical protein
MVGAYKARDSDRCRPFCCVQCVGRTAGRLRGLHAALPMFTAVVAYVRRYALSRFYYERYGTTKPMQGNVGAFPPLALVSFAALGHCLLLAAGAGSGVEAVVGEGAEGLAIGSEESHR